MIIAANASVPLNVRSLVIPRSCTIQMLSDHAGRLNRSTRTRTPGVNNSTKRTAACYIARVLAAVTYAWGILLEYILISGIAAALFFRNVPEASEASRIGKTMLAIVLQFIMIGACAMFAFMLVSLIRHSVLSMTAAVLLVLLFTPGVRVLVFFVSPDKIKTMLS